MVYSGFYTTMVDLVRVLSSYTARATVKLTSDTATGMVRPENVDI